MQRVATIGDKSFPLSYNDKLEPDMLPDGYCALIENGWLDNNRIEERTGYSLIGNDTGENKPNLGLHSHETTSGKQILKINDNALGTASNLFYWNGTGNWVKVVAPTFTPGLTYSMVTAYGKTYITNGVDTVKSWDGTTLANVASIPICKYLYFFHDFLWAIREPTQRSRANFSNQGAPETFTGGDFVDIDPENADAINGVNTLRDEMIIGKQFSMYGFQGWTDDVFGYSQFFARLKTMGVISHETMVNTGNDLLFLSFTGGIAHVHSLVRTDFSDTVYGTIVTDPIEGTMQGLSEGNLGVSSGIFDGRKVWYFVPSGSQTYNDLCFVYDTKTKGFSRHTGIYSARSVVSTVSGTTRMYFADSRNSKVYLMDGSNTDNGAVINFKFISRQFNPDFKRMFKYKYLFLQFQRGVAGTLYAWVSVDDNNFDLVDTIDLSLGPTGFSYAFPITFGGTAQLTERVELAYGVNHSIQLMLIKNDVNARTVITAYDFMGHQKSIRDLPSLAEI